MRFHFSRMTTMAATDTFRPTSTGYSNRLSAASHALFGAYSTWNDRRTTRKALNALSERELDDIGLSRGDIETLFG